MSKNSRDRSRAERAQAALEAQEQAERRRKMMVGGAIVAVLVLVVGIVFVVNSVRDTTGETPAATPDAATADYGLVVGETDTAAELVIYEDPQCPNCAQLEAQVGEDLATAVEAGDVRVEYRIVSFLDEASTNDYSSRAANALVAAYDVSGPEVFMALHQTLFAEQTAEGGPGHSDDQLVDFAVEAGAEEAEIRPLVEDGAYVQWLENATDAMSRNGVSGTPTVFVDGELAENPLEGVLGVLG
jgi:protein-disulfide isomerase